MPEKIDHDHWAKEALKYLVSLSRNSQGEEKFISYSDLARAIGYPEPYKWNVFARRIGETLGVMGRLLAGIVIEGERPPRIQVLVVGKTTGLPGKSLAEFFPEYPHLSEAQQRDLVLKEAQRVVEFGSRWDQVLRYLDIPSSLTGPDK